MKNICFKINIDIFDYEIWFFKGPVDVFRKKFGKYDNNKNPEDNIKTVLFDGIKGVTCVMGDDRRAFVYIVSDDEDTLIHETNHAIQGMLDYLGIPMGIENEELVSILQGYIQTRVLYKFGKIKKPA